MSTELSNLLAAIDTLKTLQPKTLQVDYAWRKLYRAEKYLQQQVSAVMDN